MRNVAYLVGIVVSIAAAVHFAFDLSREPTLVAPRAHQPTPARVHQLGCLLGERTDLLVQTIEFEAQHAQPLWGIGSERQRRRSGGNHAQPALPAGRADLHSDSAADERAMGASGH